MTELLKTEPLTVRTEVEELSGGRRKVRVVVPPEHAERVRSGYLREFGRRARLKGFRPGKAPARLVEQKYAGEIEEETLKDLIQDGYEAALRQAALDPVAPPAVGEVRWTAEGALEFTAEVEVHPTIELARTTGFRIERPARRVADEDVERVIERIREERADWRAVDRPAAEGDRIAFDSVPLDDAGEAMETERIENHKVEIGRGDLLPDFEAGLAGRSGGETAEFAVAFPADHPNEMLRGRTRRFRVRVDEVSERVLPALDDEFARTVADVDTVDALGERIRKNLQEEIADQGLREVNEALVDQVIEANAFDVPARLVERYLASMMADRQGPLEGRVPEERLAEVREVLRPGAERAVRRYYILKRIAEAEGLEADDAAVDAALAERIDAERISVAEARKRLQASGELEELRHHLTMERVFGWLRERSTIEAVEPDA